MSFLIILIILISLIIMYLLSGIIIHRIICHPKKRDYEKVKQEEIKSGNVINDKQFDLTVKTIEIKNKDGKKLIGHFHQNQINPQSNKYILFNHGYNYPYSSVFKYIYMFDQLGYNVLFPDHRNHGGSYKSAITFGYFEKEESYLWTKELEKIADESNGGKVIIGVMGESMGAATSLLMAADDRAKMFDFCIADCPFSSWKDIIKLRMKEQHLSLFDFFYPSIWLAVKIFDRADISKVNVAQSAKNIKIPTLIIHGLADDYVPCEMSEKIVKQNSDIKLFLQKGAKHAQSISTDYGTYKKQIECFLSFIKN